MPALVGSSGPGAAPPENRFTRFVRGVVCASGADVLAVAHLTGATVGEGWGASGGLLYGIGGMIGLSTQKVADPAGNVAFAFTLNLGSTGFGFGAIAGKQVSVSNSKNVSKLRGFSLAGDVTVGSGPAGDVAVILHLSSQFLHKLLFIKWS